MPRRWTLCHTADWHLGHALHGRSREHEHRAFLEWLVEALATREVDALIVAGDVFDSASPSGGAQALLYDFVAALRARHPSIDVIVIAGNHDSPTRLAAPDPVLRSLGVRVIGHVPWLGTGRDARIDAERLVVPIHAGGARDVGPREIVAQVIALPYLRASDLPVLEPGADDDAPADRIARATQRVYEEVAQVARARATADQALIATGHCHVSGAAISDRSERAVIGGLAGALPIDVFPADAAYVALGHLHLAQAVGGTAHVRYSGSPIPLALGEETYPHQVRLATFEGSRLVAQAELAVPRSVPILRVPREGAAGLEEVLAALRALELDEVIEERRPWLEVRVRVARPEPAMRARVDEVLAGRPVRLVRLAVEREVAAIAEASRTRVELAELGVREVFLRRWRIDHEGEPPEDVSLAFDEAVARALEPSP
jgi:exonuclease SbcD